MHATIIEAAPKHRAGPPAPKHRADRDVDAPSRVRCRLCGLATCKILPPVAGRHRDHR